MTRGIALVVAMALAGCGGESTTESAARTGEINLRNASVGEVAEQTAAAEATGAAAFTPGEWETRVEVTDAQMPGMPPAMTEQIKQQMLRVHSTKHCMTAQEAERPSEEMFAGAEQGNCRFDRYDMADGRIAAAMTCRGGVDGLGVAAITMQGRYAATSFDLESRVEATQGEGGPMMTMANRVTGKRLGDCTS